MITSTEQQSSTAKHHFTAAEFGSRAGELHADIGVTESTPIDRIHPNIKTPEQLMLFSIFEMQKHIVYMLSKTDEDIREYALYNAFFECAMSKLGEQ